MNPIADVAMRFFALLFFCLNISNVLAQESIKDQRMRQAEGYYVFYVTPRDVCAAAGPESLARIDALLTTIRKEQLQAIELVETSKEFFAVVTAARFVENERARTEGPRRNPAGECARQIELMPRMYEHHKKNKLFEYLIDLFSKPT
jgi:hypothetical protein